MRGLFKKIVVQQVDSQGTSNLTTRKESIKSILYCLHFTTCVLYRLCKTYIHMLLIIHDLNYLITLTRL